MFQTLFCATSRDSQRALVSAHSSEPTVKQQKEMFLKKKRKQRKESFPGWVGVPPSAPAGLGPWRALCFACGWAVPGLSRGGLQPALSGPGPPPQGRFPALRSSEKPQKDPGLPRDRPDSDLHGAGRVTLGKTLALSELPLLRLRCRMLFPLAGLWWEAGKAGWCGCLACSWMRVLPPSAPLHGHPGPCLCFGWEPLSLPSG